MKNNKLLIVEDNIITAKHIGNSLKKFGFEITDMVNSLEGVQKSIIKSTPDLVILDINLGRDIDGIHIAEILEKEYGISFIFLTSYNDETTINRIVKLNPLGYIIKPFNPIDLNAVIELALFKLNNKLAKQAVGFEDKVNLDEFLFVKNGRKIDRVFIPEIEFIQADGRYTYIFQENKKKICNSSLKTLKEKLADSHFVQTHKSYLVNLTKINTITLNYLVIGEHEIPISKNYRADLLGFLNMV